MKVIMLVHNDLSGDTRVMREAAALGSAGWQVTVLCLKGRDLPEVEERDGYVVRRVAEATSASWREPLRKIAQMRSRRRAFDEAAIAERPSVVHCHDTDTLPAGASVAGSAGARLVYDAHELFPDMLAGHGRGSLPVQRYWRRVERTVVPRADLVITVNEARARVLAERYGVEAVVVHNTPDVEPLVPRSFLREKLGIAEETPVVLYQGGLIAGRALGRLVGAVCSVPDAVLVLQGSGPEEQRMREAAAARGCAERVIFTGWVPPSDLHAYACGADIGVVIYENTSLNNYFAAPNKLYGYLMAGLPMIASEFPGISEVVLGEGVGGVFDPESEESIAEAMRSLLDDPSARRAMSARARSLAEQRYNWPQDAAHLVEAYSTLAAHHEGGRR